MFQVNEVVQYEDELFRLLAIYQSKIAWIEVYNDKAFPSFVDLNELRSAVDEEILVRESDPYEFLLFERPEEGTVARTKRDANYSLIEPIIADDEALLPTIRSARINEIIDKNISTKQTLYRLLRQYWQRGQTVNAMIPKYKNSGAKGKKRQAKDKKLGRPRENMPGVGALVDTSVERLFRIAIEKYLLTDKKISLPYAHRKFKSIFKTHYASVSESEIPTFWQMQYFYKREYHQVEVIQKRTSKIEYEKDIRPLTSTANTGVLGPGSRFEIDATIADVYLVSISERQNIIGRPTVYLVIDVFSRMIVGIYIGMESPSYATAMQALSNAMTDKVEYCKNYGIDIGYEDWPVAGLPDAILADRGELFGYQIESLESNFSIRIENTPPYRGDAKGIVERYFKTIQAKFKPYAPGVVDGTIVKKRGGSDYRLDAKLNVDEFTEIILASVIYHNRYHTMTKYDRDIDIPTSLEMTPLSLWNWGTQNRTGKLRSVSVDAINIALMPRIKATISDLGICVYGVYYTCQEVVQNGWLHRSKAVKRPKALEVGYDPRTANQVYLFPKRNSAEYWVCNLTPRSREYLDCSFWDIWKISAEQKKTLAKSKLISDKKHRELDNKIEEKIKKAKSEILNKPEIPNSQRIAEIKKYRQVAKEQERRKTAFHPNKTKNNKLADVISINDQDEDYSFPDFVDELFGEDK